MVTDHDTSSENPAINQEHAPYYALGPDRVLDAVEDYGLMPDGHVLALNSYENRVYQVGIEGHAPIVIKFYRPGRWSDAAIQEEHDFTLTLAGEEIPVVAPLRNDNGDTLQEFEGYRYAVFPRQGGRAPELDIDDTQLRIGRFIGRIHMVGAAKAFSHRPTIGMQEFGFDAYEFIMEHGFIPRELEIPYRTLVEDVLKQIETGYERAGTVRHIRLHGDCHPGNILWTDDGPHFVDLDDTRMGPAVQDLWMLLSGERDAMQHQLSLVLEGYTEFFDFDPVQLQLIEPLRTLRIIHYASWLARRWQDPAFPHNFPWFNTPRYWEEHILQLREQAALLDEPSLAWYG